MRKHRIKESALATMLGAGIALGIAKADEIRVEFENPQVNPGQTSSYVIRIDAQSIPEQVTAITYQGNTLPSAIQSVDGWDAFTQGGWFTGGFWNGEQVAQENINNNSGVIIMSPNTLPGPIGNNELAVRYTFTVDPSATPGVYSHNLNSSNTTLTLFNGMSPPFSYFPPVTAGSFEVVPSQIPGDINGDGVRDATDIQLYTNVLLGTETNPTYRQRADMNGDGLNNGADTQGFVTAFLQ